MSNYLSNNPDVNQAVGGSLEGALEHLITYGFAEGRQGSQESFGADSANLQVVEQMYEALGRGDNTSFQDLLTEDTVWKFAGDKSIIPFAGEWQGRQGVANLFATIGQATQSDFFQIRGFFEGEDQIVSLLHEDLTVKANSREYVVDVYNLITVRNGQISRLDGVFDSAISQAAFLGNSTAVAQSRDALTGMPLARSSDAAVTQVVAQQENNPPAAISSDAFSAFYQADSGALGPSVGATVQPDTYTSGYNSGQVLDSLGSLLQTPEQNISFLQSDPIFSV